jgi:3-phenylpropionate/cinnamic acid dioxygenase small subunit
MKEASPTSPPTAVPAEDLQREVERFLHREARLLDQRRFQEWLSLFTEDTRYWMPVRRTRLSEGRAESWEIEKELSGEHEVAYFDDDLPLLQLRVARLATDMAWAENPPSRTRHLVTNIEVEFVAGLNEYQVESYFIVYQSRLETREALFVGYRSDTLRRVNGELKIAGRKIVLDSGVLNASTLSIFF